MGLVARRWGITKPRTRVCSRAVSGSDEQGGGGRWWVWAGPPTRMRLASPCHLPAIPAPQPQPPQSPHPAVVTGRLSVAVGGVLHGSCTSPWRCLWARRSAAGPSVPSGWGRLATPPGKAVDVTVAGVVWVHYYELPPSGVRGVFVTVCHENNEIV